MTESRSELQKAPASAGVFFFGDESPYHRVMEYPSCRVALVGLMGAGKSRIGRQVASLCRWPFFDTDRMVEDRAGASIESLFRERGEVAFRDLETEALVELSQTSPPLVAALGGGVVVRPENRTLLQSFFFVVWLDVDPEQAAERLGRGAGRPVLAGRPPIVALKDLWVRREPWYREVAHVILDANSTDAAEVGRAVCAAIDPH